MYAISASLLSPLFTLKDLTVVLLEAPIGFRLDDISATSLARAWPRITLLQIGSDMSKGIPSDTTLHALLAFAQFCPSLKQLRLPLDARTVPEWEAFKLEDKRPQQVSLSRLGGLSDSPIGDPFKVALFLSSVFPKLTSLGGVRRHPADDAPWDQALYMQWQTAEALLALLHRARDEERYWAERAGGQ
ncbi:hypothetical protein FB45DRAFT_1008921 [Roridomyces roridus]|uniref:Uncharacterized protein n=1 Tax=Roridomyces roridus TaxID=1738132 RepID=A0AAD7FB47_9AGAR|nr:hypothetical protein FB45DRAFT_1008921 [Roridomyces roridus]